jgi:hypothetical protein
LLARLAGKCRKPSFERRVHVNRFRWHSRILATCNSIVACDVPLGPGRLSKPCPSLELD